MVHGFKLREKNGQIESWKWH